MKYFVISLQNKPGVTITMNDTNEHHEHSEHDHDRYLSGKNMTLEEIGQVLGLTKERVRQIEESALRKVAMILKRRGITCSGDLL